MIQLNSVTLATLAWLLHLSSAAAASPSCGASPAVWGGFPELPRVAAALGGEGGLRIVALGSSSTKGVGASAPDRSYPAQLERLLRARYPRRRIEVLNRGVGGETVAGNLARLDRDVLTAGPDLVIWQVGTNDALLGLPADEVRVALGLGIERIKASGADVVLLDPQPLLEPRRAAALARMEAVLIDVAQAKKVPLLPRQALMRHWLVSGRFAPDTLLGHDGLHMTDASYRCLAERVADLFVRRDQRP